jgi:benzodiazapine receptor
MAGADAVELDMDAGVLGLVVIVCLLVTVIAFIIKARDRFAGWCFAPYALWLCFATSLNAAIFVLN